MKRSVLAILAIAALAVPAAARAGGQATSDAAPVSRQIDAVRTTGPIRLDGALDEPDWQRAPVATGFLQSDPHEGEPASEATEVRVLYDNETLYIGVFAQASHDITVNDLSKDFNIAGGDVFEVALDTFDDQRNGFLFATNPMGAKWDAQSVNQGRDVNSDWDAIWDVKTRITPRGWYAEIAIPFRTLRFQNESTQTWGINFFRRIRRRNEDSYWSPVPRIFNITRTSLEGALKDLRGLHPGSDIRVKPYVLTSDTRLAPAPSDRNLQGGFDVKWGITSGLTWDFTVNTDFSQVEADEQQVNLTRFSLFFPEKRDFFLENSGVFQFGTPGTTGGTSATGGRTNGLPDNVLFFSRTIGLSSDGQALPILGGTRLTGHVGEYSIGALNIQQRASGAEPATNFTALRVRRNVFSNSDVGVLFLNKQQGGGAYNRVAGADANFWFFDNLNITAFAVTTSSPDSFFAPQPAAVVPPAAVTPGSDATPPGDVPGGTPAPGEPGSLPGTVITPGTPVTGPGTGTPPGTPGVTGGSSTMWRAAVAYHGELVDASTGYNSTGDRFNDEMGFIPRVGIGRADGRFGLHLRPKAVSSWLREFFPHYQVVNTTRTADGGFDSRYMDFHLPFTFQNSSFVEVGKNTNVEVLTAPFVIDDTRNIGIDAGRYSYDEYFVTGNTDQGRALWVNGRVGTGRFYDGTKQSYYAGTGVRMSANLNASLSLLRNEITLRHGAYNTDLITGRVNYAFSTRAFLNALLQYNTDVQEWSSNIRFDIIHHPLSDLFLVYNDHRDTVTGWLKDRSIAAKMTYMLAF